MRALGVDLGAKRIGIAISDSMGVLATPLTLLERSGTRSIDHQRIAALVEEEGAGIVVVGLPVDLKGSQAIAASKVNAEVSELATVVGVPVETFDERMSTAVAMKQMRAVADLGGRKKSLKASDKKKRIDSGAAAVILQGWLDSRS